MERDQERDIEELFEEDPAERNKFKDQLPQGADKDQTVFHYFDPNANKKHMTKKRDQTMAGNATGFDLTAFRIKQ